tara:strand:+ start:35453 stop:36214 length:762 start_codon:yes stop_codon:yes gene_type:complete
MQKLSVTIICKNEVRNIRACLESVKWADEIVVLDSGSSDGTLDIVKEYTDKVVQTDWPGFGIQKNRALDKASHDWILSIDADERISPELQTSIKTILKQDPSDISAFKILRRSSYCGRFLKHGNWKRDYCIRLFQKNKARFKEVPVHENLIVQGQVQKIDGLMIHESFRTLDEVITKMNHYSSLSSEERFQKGQRGGLGKAIRHALWNFFYGYIFRGGFLDGREGFMLAISNAEGTFYRYAKLMYLYENSKAK